MGRWEGYNGTRLTLCEERTKKVWITVWVQFEDEKLTVIGQDLGDAPREWFGSDEYEYFYFFDQENTDKMLRMLADGQKDPMEELKHRFSGRSGCSNLRSFCEQHGIQYMFDSWTE